MAKSGHRFINQASNHAPQGKNSATLRRLNEEAVATIVRGFLNISIEGLPDSLKHEIDGVIQQFSLK